MLNKNPDKVAKEIYDSFSSTILFRIDDKVCTLPNGCVKSVCRIYIDNILSLAYAIDNKELLNFYLEVRESFWKLTTNI